jgi:hypothetical protein
MAYLVQALQKPTDRDTAYVALGYMALTLGSKVRGFMDDVVKVIKDHLRQKGYVQLFAHLSHHTARGDRTIRRRLSGNEEDWARRRESCSGTRPHGVLCRTSIYMLSLLLDAN